MESTTDRAQVYPAETAWDEEESPDRPRPGYARVSAPVAEWPTADEANSDLGNSGRDVTDSEFGGFGDAEPTR